MSRRKLGSRPQHLSVMQGTLDLKHLYLYLNDKTCYVCMERCVFIM